MIPDILSRWSPSKLGMLSRCQYQFFRHYILGENKPPSVAMAFGSAFDVGAGAILSDGIAQGKAGPVSVGQDAFALAWGWERESVQDWDGEDADKLEAEGVRLVAHWREVACEGLTPLAVQERFTVPVVPGLEVEGIIDARAAREVPLVVEIKTAGKPWRSRDARAAGKVPTKALQSLQAVAYTIGASVTTGTLVDKVEFQVGARGGKSDVDLISVTVDSPARRGYLACAMRAQAQAQECARTGLFMPTAHMCGHFLCSKKFCGWWRECIQEFGGERPD